MSKKVNDMIRELVQMVEKELGQPMPAGSAHRLEEALCRQYGGERLYLPKLPKLVAQVRLAAIGTGQANAELAGQMGVSVRQVRRYLRGR
jgi:Mor family transcriptional regulator